MFCRFVGLSVLFVCRFVVFVGVVGLSVVLVLYGCSLWRACRCCMFRRFVGVRRSSVLSFVSVV